MKKLYFTIMVLFGFLIFAFFKASTPKENNHIPSIGILQLTSHPALDEIHRGIIDTLKENGYVNKKNIKINFLNAENDQSNLNTMSNKFVNDHVDAAVGIATPSAQALKNATSNIPIVLGAVTNPKNSGLVKNNLHSGNNVTGVSDQAPIGQQLSLINKIMPDIKSIGIIYTSSDPSATIQMKQFKKLAEKRHLKVHVSSISSLNDLSQVTKSLVSNVDAIYIPTDNTVASGLNNIRQITTEAKVPIFPAAETMIADGGLATVGLSQYKIGQETGKMVVSIIKDKKDPKEMPIKFITKGKLILNQKQASKLGIKFPKQLVQEAKEKGEIIK